MKKNGFTLIEVVLVLGIGGLIMLMAFIALPAVWANERDSERRNDVTLFINKLKSFQTNNNRGALPDNAPVYINGATDIPTYGTWEPISGAGVTSWQAFYKEYFSDSFVDPAGERYNWDVRVCGGVLNDRCSAADLTGVDYTLHIYTGATCDGDHAVKSANTRNVAVEYKLERAGQYCANS